MRMRDDMLHVTRTCIIHQTLTLRSGISITPYYAGHVLGAAMFDVRIASHSCVYTGDYNMTPDRHLGSAIVPRLEPHVLITESTYATTVRESKRAREQAFLMRVKETVMAGGKGIQHAHVQRRCSAVHHVMAVLLMCHVFLLSVDPLFRIGSRSRTVHPIGRILDTHGSHRSDLFLCRAHYTRE